MLAIVDYIAGVDVLIGTLTYKKTFVRNAFGAAIVRIENCFELTDILMGHPVEYCCHSRVAILE